jgi:uncharacterized protein (DUF2141 family)
MKLTVLFLLVCAMAICLQAEETFTISGQVLIDGPGVVYIHLVDAKQFEIPFTGILEIIVPTTPASVEVGSIPFEFGGVPPGRYGIRIFIDRNNNRKLDRGLFGPREPWGMSWNVEKLFRIPNFRDIAFDLEGDMTKWRIDTR